MGRSTVQESVGWRRRCSAMQRLIGIYMHACIRALEGVSEQGAAGRPISRGQSGLWSIGIF
jgi:hypothetical protein